MVNDVCMIAGFLGLLVLTGNLWAEEAGNNNSKEQSAASLILGNQTLWRARLVHERDEILLKSGKVKHVKLKYDKKALRKVKTVENFTVEELKPVRLPEHTSPDWMKPEFDNSAWARTQIPTHGARGRATGDLVYWKKLMIRGWFEVPDPARADGLTLSIEYLGGVVVYLNGEELTRSHMPPGKLTPYANAEPYDRESALTKDGYLPANLKDKNEKKRLMGKRIRALNGFRIPVSRLRKGRNLLAVAAYRAPIHWSFYTTRTKKFPMGMYRKEMTDGHTGYVYGWRRMSIERIQLTSPSSAAVKANVSRTKGRGFVAWNHSILRKVRFTDYADPFEGLKPVKLQGTRNGTFAGQIVAGDDKPIKGLTVNATDLAGPSGVIPASAVRVRYSLDDRGNLASRGARAKPWFTALTENPPEEIPLRKNGGSIQPIWITVTVPPEVKAGTYKGQITIAAEHTRKIQAPLELCVVDWTLPHKNDFVAWNDFVQSPESLAMAYNVPLWSEKHWALLDKTFRLLAGMADKSLYITAVRRTHYGNEHAMIRWKRGADGLEPDLSIAERYIDVAVKHLGKIPAVILYAWEPPDSMGHSPSIGTYHDREILITRVSSRSGRLRKATGPAWGTPECRAFWKKLNTAMLAMLKKRGMEDSLTFGLLGDHRATKLAVEEISTGVPYPKWAMHSHGAESKWMGQDVSMVMTARCDGCDPKDPDEGRWCGWQNKIWLGLYPRYMDLARCSIVDFHVLVEGQLSEVPRNTAATGKHAYSKGLRGIGRIGADFWPVLTNRRGQLRGSIAGRYPETRWGQLCITYGLPCILEKGKNGPIPTVRTEAIRENVQAYEARAFIEKALADKTKKARLGTDLSRRCREMLDERIRMCNHAQGEGWVLFVSSDWAERNGKLFELAGEVAAKISAVQAKK